MKFIIPILFIAVAASAHAQFQTQGQTQGQRQRLNNANLNTNTFNPANNVTGVNRNANVNRNRAKARVNKSGNSFSRSGVKGKLSNTSSNVVSPTVSVESVDNSVSMAPTIPAFNMNVDYLTWLETRKTAKGMQISHLDPRVTKAIPPKTMPKDSKARYDAWLVRKGISPKTLGPATITADRSLDIPSIEQQFNNSGYEQMLVASAQ